MTFLFLFATSLAITFAVTPVARNYFRKRGWVDHPDQTRKLHAAPIPRLGGIPISLAFFSSILILQFAPATLAGIFRNSAETSSVYTVLWSSLLILGLGIWDDIKGASPTAKIAVQSLAAIWLWVSEIRIERIGIPGTSGIDLGMLSLPITILWVVGITNAFNLVDGLDGLASGVAFFAATTMFAVAVLTQNNSLAILTASLSGATLGFLRFNFNPATVFLGDSGSLFLGFLLSAFAIVWSAKASTLVAVVAPLFALGLPIAEIGISVVRRYVRGQPIFSADREHIHHRLLGQGFTPRKAVLILYAVSAALGVASLLLANWQTRTTGLILLVMVGLAWLGIQQLGYHEFGEVGDSFRRGLFQQRRMINAHVRLRGISEAFANAGSWSDLTEVLVEVGSELGFQGIDIDLRGHGPLPPGIGEWSSHSCTADRGQLWRECPEQYWRVDIPLGTKPGDTSRLVMSRAVADGTTPYLVSTMVQVLTGALPSTMERVLAAESLRAGLRETPVPDAQRA